MHPLPVNTEIFSMVVGRKLPVKILEVTQKGKSFVYKVEYIGNETVCLDWGQNWFLKHGDTHTVYDFNVDAARKYA